MSENNFIQIQDLFVTSSEPKRYGSYKASQDMTSEYLQNSTHWNRFGFQRSFIIVNPNEAGEIDGSTSIGKVDCSFYQSYNEIKNDYYGISKILKEVGECLKKSNIVDAKFNAFCHLMKEAIIERQEYYKKYGRFTLSVAKYILKDEDIACLKNISENVDSYLKESDKINKKAKELKKQFKEVVSKYLKEHYEHILYKTSNSYHTEKLRTEKFYCPVKETFFFPLINFTKTSSILFEEMKKSNLKKENFLNLMNSVEEKNAKKKINGYVVYANNSSEEKESSDGFLNKDGYLTSNILTAIVFETNKQAHSYAKRRGYQKCIITEINFEFSKIMENHECIMGPAMNSLISRREQGDLKEMFGELGQNRDEQKSEEALVEKKKNKI